MKVLKAGRKQKGWAVETRCTGSGNGNGGCGAKLLVEQGDLFRTSRTDMGGDTDYYDTFECSECGVFTDIKGVPSAVSSCLSDYKNWKKSHKPESV